MNTLLLLSSQSPSVLLNARAGSGRLSQIYPINFSTLSNGFNSTLLNFPQRGTKKIFENLLNPQLESERANLSSTYLEAFRSNYRKIGMKDSFPFIFEILQHSTMPCSDKKGITAEKDGDAAILKSCAWKGKSMPCASIFSVFPTDRGMCCSFNKKNADEIFSGKMYTTEFLKNRGDDRALSFQNTTLMKWYIGEQEPQTEVGLNKGLEVVLDAHNDLLSPGTVSSDFQGLIAMIDSKGSFPMITQKGFVVKPGHYTAVALSATQISANQNIISIHPTKRKCYFEIENQILQLHKEYSQSNCFLECVVLSSQNALMMEANMTMPCTPWYFPFNEGTSILCDPWESQMFTNHMFLGTRNDDCTHCLADCHTTSYQSTITTSPFRACDETSLGVSHFCNLEDNTLPDPKIWSKHVKDEYNETDAPDFINKLISSERFMTRTPFTFSKMKSNYDAYENDIAVLQVYFDTPTVFLFESNLKQTWVGFFSTIGGLLGLCIGLSIVTIIELFWLVMCLGAQLLKPNYK